MSDDTLPSWMHSQLFNEILKKNYPCSKMISFHISANTEKTYLGGIYRARIKFAVNETDEELFVFIKTVSENESVARFMHSMNVYNKELDFYELVMPKLDSLFTKSHLNLFPKVLYTSKAPFCIALEDISKCGCQMPSLRPGADVEMAQAVLQNLAIFHAGCAAIQEPNFFQNFKHGLFNRTGSDTMVIHQTTLNAVIDLVSKWKDFEPYHMKLCKFRESLAEKGRKAFDANEKQFNTLNHGDLWLGNVMFKENFNNLKLIDFQNCCWTSPTIDLQLFLNASLEHSVHKKSIPDLVKYYHEHLVDALKKFHYQNHIPTLDELMSDFNERSVCGLAWSCSILPEVFVDHPPEGLETILSDDQHAREFKRAIYDDPIAQDIVRFFVPYYDQFGVFD